MSPGEEPPKQFEKNLSPHIKEREKLIRSQPGWWLNLKKYQPGFDILEVVKNLGLKIVILSKPPKKGDNAWSEKAIGQKNMYPMLR